MDIRISAYTHSVKQAIQVLKDGVICSTHFRNSDYDECKKPRKILKRDSISSQYLNFPTTPNEPFNLNLAEKHCSGNKGLAYKT
jgi:hypothetical protein